MEHVKIENTEQPFLVDGFDSSSSSESHTPLCRSSSRKNKRQIAFRPSCKYDHVSSKVKEYRNAIRNQATKRKENSPYEDTSETTSSEDPLKIIENLKQDIKMRDIIIDRKDEEMAELMGKHVEEVALLKMSLDSFRYELMRLKGTIDISRPYSKPNNEMTPLKSFGNMLKTPIRSISNALLIRTPLKSFSSTSGPMSNDMKNNSITSDDVVIEEPNSREETPNQKAFLKSSVKKKSPERINFYNSNAGSSVSKANISDQNLKKTKDQKRKSILEQSVSSVFSKVVFYSHKVFSKNVPNTEKVQLDENPQTSTNLNDPKLRNTRRRVSFSKACTESPLPTIIVEDTTRDDSPKNCFVPPRKMKKLKASKYVSAKHTKENYLKSRMKNNNAENYFNYKDHQTLVAEHIDEIIARSKEIKKIMHKL